MTDLGCVSAEIVELCLEDIDWRAGAVVRKNKQRRERLLPLGPLVAKAIVSYLSMWAVPFLADGCLFAIGYRWPAHDSGTLAVRLVGHQVWRPDQR
jgi:integrase